MRRHLARTLPLVLSILIASGPAQAQAQADNSLSPTDEILSTLRTRGYDIVENERTWLGRQRIVARKDGTSREVVFIPATGEILRDYAISAGGAASNRLAGDGGAAGGNETVGSAVETSVGSAGVVGTADAMPSVSVGESLGTGRTTDKDSPASGGTP